MNKITSVLIAITLTSLVWLVAIEEERYKHLRAIEKDVWLPTMTIIRDLNSTLAERDYETLEKKLQLFYKRWRDYFPDGDNPLMFRKEILDIGVTNNPDNGLDLDEKK
ncbi:MAG: hypothetical protein RQ824_08555 [bacterium]|nr:hypothetical protein [bacterium]